MIKADKEICPSCASEDMCQLEECKNQLWTDKKEVIFLLYPSEFHSGIEYVDDNEIVVIRKD